MDVILLIACACAAWLACKVFVVLPSLGQLWVPSPWLFLIVGLGLVTWLMHD